MVNAIVRYGAPIARRTRAGQVAAAYNTFRRYYPMMREAFRRRRQIRMAASRVQRAFRRYRGRPVRRGNRVAGQRNRVPRLQTFYNFGGIETEPTTSIVSIPRKTLYSADIKFARIDEATRKIGEVVGQRIYLKGVKVCLNAKNIAPPGTTNDNYILHFALIQPKGPEANRPLAERFFVQPGGGFTGNERNFDFPDVQNDPSWDPRVNCNGINPTRFNIITHKKFNIYALNAGGPVRDSHVNMERYYAVNKYFNYNSPTNDDVDRPIYICIWYENMVDAGATADTGMQWSCNTITYFKSII